MDNISVLQIGNTDWSEIYQMPEYIDFYYAEEFTEKVDILFDLVFLDRALRRNEIGPLHRSTKAYTLFATERVELNEMTAWLCRCKKGKRINSAYIQDFFLREARNYFSKPYGEKYRPKNMAIAHGFLGSVKWNGGYSVSLEGDYGSSLNQIVYWRNNIPIFQGQCIDFWLEYKKEPEVSIGLSITQFVKGSIAKVQQKWIFSEQELDQIVRVDNQMAEGPIFVSLLASGKGKLEIIALHDRYSRRGRGNFLPGGERYVTSEREEIFCYFDPGDLKPPLNVYFSGYKTMEGFEGYYLMRGMGCPFLLISESRMEGGCFYMGSSEYESLLADLIRKYMTELGFTSDQVILSGLSMGTFGALYYGCDIKPHAMILGKPLPSVGNVAANEKLFRPGGFPTSLDVLRYLCGDTDEAAIERLNRRFWDKFAAADWSCSKFIISYMLEDDYDSTAYTTLIDHIRSDGVQLYGKGLHGRHNDNTPGIVNWFANQYKQVLAEDFHRRMDR